jgi:hypothetical protein
MDDIGNIIVELAHHGEVCHFANFADVIAEAEIHADYELIYHNSAESRSID